MRFRIFIFILFYVCFSSESFAQNKDDLTQSRILILLDGSSSMIHKWADGREKFKAAGDLILKLMDSAYTVNNQVEFSLRVFGHQHTMEEDYCFDTKNEVPFAKDNRLQMALRLEALQPLGVTPIAYALQQAAEYDLTDEAHNAYSIILITDGGESCGGDICEVMRTLIQNKVYFKPYILSLEDDPELKNTYACMGDYLQVTRKQDMAKAVGVIVDAFRPVLKITQSDYKQLQSDVAKNQPRDTAATPAVKTWKTDTLVAEVIPTRPPAVNMGTAIISPLLSFPVNVSQDYIITVLDPTVLPPVVREPAQPVIMPAMPHGRPMQLPVNKTWDISVHPVGPTKLPAISKEIQAIPQPVKIVAIPHNRAALFAVCNTWDISPSAMAPAPLPPTVKETPVLAHTKITAIPLRQQNTFPVNPNTNIALSRMERYMSLPPVVKEVPHVTPGKVAILPTVSTKPLDVNTPAPAEVSAVAPVTLPAIAPEKPPRPVVNIPRLKTSPVNRFNLLIVIEEKNFQYRAIPPLPPFKAEEVAKVTKPAPAKTAQPKPDVSTVPPAKKAEIKTETEDAKETTLEVYFTNGKGKFYESTPQVVLVDPATNKDVKSFYRFVDADGNPDPQKDIMPGTYNITFSTKRSLVAPNVVIEKNKRNKVYITVKNTSLSFQYANAPTRPMTEFTAIVTERNKTQGRVQRQKCTEKLEYEPENYHIEINTFPPDVRNVDLNFDLETEIKILQPGFVKFTNEINASSATLYERDGDRYLRFSNWDLNDPRSSHLQIQPGEYQVHYQKGPVNSYAAEQVIPFTVRSTEVTEVILK